MKFSGRFWFAAVLVAFVLFIGLIAPFIVRTDPDLSIGGRYDAPSPASGLAYMLGLDFQGQSVLANLVDGTRTSLTVGLIAGVIASLIGLIIGLVAGYAGGIVEEILMGFTNVSLAIPSIVIVVLLSIALPSRNIVTLAVVIGITSWPWTARAVRAQATAVRTREHIEVARMSGAGFWSILGWDVLPYLLSYVVMAFVLQVAGAILTESSLSMLGLGPSSIVSIGMMLNWALATGAIRTGAWWAIWPPTLMLTLIAFSFLLMQSSLDEVFNPRLRRGAKRKKAASTPEAGAAVGLPALEEAVEAGASR